MRLRIATTYNPINNMHKEAFYPNFFVFQQLMISPIIVKIPSFPFFSSLHNKFTKASRFLTFYLRASITIRGKICMPMSHWHLDQLYIWAHLLCIITPHIPEIKQAFIQWI
jgi:hypothetical protein